MSNILLKLISSLGELEFKKLVVELLKYEMQTNDVRIVDGPYDGGNDAEITKDGGDIKRNIQITIQNDKFETKLEEDLVKAKQNVNKYNYLQVLDFYISKRVTKEKRNKLELAAEINYGIRLKIVDGNILAQKADAVDSLKALVYRLHEVPYEEPNNIIDRQSKVLFDILTLNNKNVEIKKHFIHSFIYSFIYAGLPDHSGQKDSEIIRYTQKQLPNITEQFISRELNFLRLRQELISPADDKKYFMLSDEKRDAIEQIYEVVSCQESELNDTIDQFIVEHNINCHVNDLVNAILKLYNENYNIDVSEVVSSTNNYSNSIKNIYNELVRLLEKKGCNNASDIAKELLNICGKNEYLSKIASSQLFINLSSSDKLENYLNQKQQQVFLDTQILLRLVCVFYSEYNFSDIAMQSTKMLWDTLSNNKYNVSIHSSYDYIDEVAGHFLEAYQLCRFMSPRSVITNLKSKNVFFNSYSELKSTDSLEQNIDSFYDYLCDIVDIELAELSSADILVQVQECFQDIFKMYNIKLVSHNMYPNFNTIKVDYENSLSYLGKYRSYTARENDLRTILFLSSDILQEPYLITWDTAFYEFRKNLSKNNKLSHWYIYTPSKIVDRLSVMNFKVNPKAINLNIISMVEDNFNYTSKTHTFLDTISRFFTDKDVSKYRVIQGLNALHKETKIVETVDISSEYEHEENDSTTRLLLDIIKHYSSQESKHSFESVIKLFEKQEFENSIIEIFKKYKIDHSKDTYKHIDSLLDSMTDNVNCNQA